MSGVVPGTDNPRGGVPVSDECGCGGKGSAWCNCNVPASPALPEGSGAWLHLTDGSQCPEQFPLGHRHGMGALNAPDGSPWWCTTHQSHLVWAGAALPEGRADGAAIWCDSCRLPDGCTSAHWCMRRFMDNRPVVAVPEAGEAEPDATLPLQEAITAGWHRPCSTCGHKGQDHDHEGCCWGDPEAPIGCRCLEYVDPAPVVGEREEKP